MTGRLFCFLAWLTLAAVPLAALSDPTAEELDRNRRKLEKWRGHPERYARLLRDANSFFHLPAQRREQIIRLDQALAEESSSAQARLLNVLERYADWLGRLEEKDRQRIKEAPDKEKRLEVITELREQAWLQQQPKAIRQQVEKLQGKPRQEFIQKLRQEEKQRQLEWLIAGRFWEELQKKRPMPCRLADFPNDVQMFVNEYLKPLLTKEEKERLDKAQGQWPLYPLTLVEIADKHPVALPGPDGPRHFADLPTEVQRRFKPKMFLGKLAKKMEGRWPEFAQFVTEMASKQNFILPHELWPYNVNGLSSPVKEFVEKELQPLLDADEKLRLVNAVGKWPAYPKTLDDLARSHHLRLPWQTLPGPPSRWQNYRLGEGLSITGYPELSRKKLRDFALLELDDNERAALNISFADPFVWQRLTQVYFQRKQDELRRLRQHDVFRQKKKLLKK